MRIHLNLIKILLLLAGSGFGFGLQAKKSFDRDLVLQDLSEINQLSGPSREINEKHIFRIRGQAIRIKGFFTGARDVPSKKGNVGGTCARLLYGSGLDNHGIYFYKSANAKARVLKVIDDSEVSISSQLFGALIGESLGGPKIYGFGYANIDNFDTLPYIEMEELFPDEKAKTYKVDWQRSLPSIVKAHPQGEKVLAAIADALVAALEKKTVPSDPDFLISKKGAIRWIDTGYWRYSSNGDLGLRFSEVILSFLPVKREREPKSEIFDAKAAEVYRGFMARFLGGIKKSQLILESQKKNLLEDLFLKNVSVVGSEDHHAGDYGTMPEILYRAGVLSDPKMTAEEAFSRIIEFYNAI